MIKLPEISIKSAGLATEDGHTGKVAFRGVIVFANVGILFAQQCPLVAFSCNLRINAFANTRTVMFWCADTHQIEA